MERPTRWDRRSLLRLAWSVSCAVAAGCRRVTTTPRLVVVADPVWSDEESNEFTRRLAYLRPGGRLPELTHEAWHADPALRGRTANALEAERVIAIAESFEIAQAMAQRADLAAVVFRVHVTRDELLLEELFRTALAPICGVVTAVNLNGKLVELLHDALPHCRRAAYLYDPAEQTWMLDESVPVARAFGIELRGVPLTEQDDPQRVAHSIARGLGASGCIVPVSAPVWPRREAFAQALANARVAAVFERYSAVESGALLAFGPDRNRPHDQLAELVAQVLDGANPRALAVLGPDRIRLGVNLRIAARAGVVLPTGLMRRADMILQ